MIYCLYFLARTNLRVSPSDLQTLFGILRIPKKTAGYTIHWRTVHDAVVEQLKNFTFINKSKLTRKGHER